MIRKLLVALAALAITAGVLWAGVTHYTSAIYGTSFRASGNMYAAGADSVGSTTIAGAATVGTTLGVTGATTLTGAVTCSDNLLVTGIFRPTRLSGALPDTTTAEGYGDGHMFFSTTGGTLFVWDADAKVYDAVAMAITKVAN